MLYCTLHLNWYYAFKCLLFWVLFIILVSERTELIRNAEGFLLLIRRTGIGLSCTDERTRLTATCALTVFSLKGVCIFVPYENFFCGWNSNMKPNVVVIGQTWSSGLVFWVVIFQVLTYGRYHGLYITVLPILIIKESADVHSSMNIRAWRWFWKCSGTIWCRGRRDTQSKMATGNRCIPLADSVLLSEKKGGRETKGGGF